MRAAAAAAALLFAFEARAGSYSWSGALGAGASRGDNWSTDAPRLTLYAWDWEADLGFAAVPFRPGLVQVIANGQYRSLWAGDPDGTNSSHGLTYGLGAALLGDSIVPISFAASRSLSRFSSSATTDRTGSTLTTTENANIALRKAGFPSLWLQVTRTDLDNQSFAADRTTAGNTTLSAGISHSTPRQEFSASYDTGWNQGSWAETNFRSHSVQAQSSTNLSDALRFRVTERYFLRLPTLEAPTNPRYDDNAFGAGVQWRPGERLTSSLDYGYRHLVVTALGADELEQRGHSLRESTSYRVTDDVTLNENAAVQTTTERKDGESASGSSAIGGGGVGWRHHLRPGLELTAGVGGSAGVAWPAGAEAQLAYGGTVSAGVSATSDSARGSVNYSGSYQRNTSGLVGWSLTQQLNLTGDAVFGSTLLRSTVLLSGARREDPLLGVFLSRSILFSLAANWRSYGIQASAGQSDGVSGALSEPGVADGLFLPANFNTRVRYGTLSASLNVPFTKITVSALARTLSTEGPDRPIRHENSASLSLGYSIGASMISLDERISTGGSAGIWQTGNSIQLRAVRSFGGPL